MTTLLLDISFVAIINFASSVLEVELSQEPHLTPLYGLRFSRYRRGYAFQCYHTGKGLHLTLGTQLYLSFVGY